MKTGMLTTVSFMVLTLAFFLSSSPASAEDDGCAGMNGIQCNWSRFEYFMKHGGKTGEPAAKLTTTPVQPIAPVAGEALITQDGAGITQGGGRVISNDGGSLISQDGAGLISRIKKNGLVGDDGSSLVGNDGSSLIGKVKSPGLISQDGAGIIGEASSGILVNNGGNVISNDGGSVISKAAAAAAISGMMNNLVGYNGSRLVGNDGSSVIQKLVGNDGSSIISERGAGIISEHGLGVISNDGGSLIGKVKSPNGDGIMVNNGANVISNDGGSLKDGAGVGGGKYSLQSLPSNPAQRDAQGALTEAVNASQALTIASDQVKRDAALLANAIRANDQATATQLQDKLDKDNSALTPATVNFVNKLAGVMSEKDSLELAKNTAAAVQTNIAQSKTVVGDAVMTVAQTAAQKLSNASDLVTRDRAALDTAIANKDQSLVGQLLAKLDSDTHSVTTAVAELGNKVSDVQTKGQQSDKTAAQALFNQNRDLAVSRVAASTVDLSAKLATVHDVAAYAPTAAETQRLNDANNAAAAAKAASDKAFAGLSFDRPTDPEALKVVNQKLAVAGISAREASVAKAEAGLAEMQASGASNYEVQNYKRDVLDKAKSDLAFVTKMAYSNYAIKRVDADVAANDLTNANAAVAAFKQANGGQAPTDPKQLAIYNSVTDLQKIAQDRADITSAIVAATRLSANGGSEEDIKAQNEIHYAKQRDLNALVSKNPALTDITNVTAAVKDLITTAKNTPAAVQAVATSPSAPTGGGAPPAISQALAAVLSAQKDSLASTAEVSQKVATVAAQAPQDPSPVAAKSLGTVSAAEKARDNLAGQLNNAKTEQVHILTDPKLDDRTRATLNYNLTNVINQIQGKIDAANDDVAKIKSASVSPAAAVGTTTLSTNPGVAKPTELVNDFTRAANAIGFAQQFKKPDGSPDRAAATEYIGKLAAKLSPEAMSQWVNAANGKGAPSPLAIAELTQARDVTQAEMTRARSESAANTPSTSKAGASISTATAAVVQGVTAPVNNLSVPKPSEMPAPVKITVEQKKAIQQALQTVPGKLTPADEKTFNTLSSLADRAAAKGLTPDEVTILKTSLKALAERHPKAEQKHGLTSLAGSVKVTPPTPSSTATSVAGAGAGVSTGATLASTPSSEKTQTPVKISADQNKAIHQALRTIPGNLIKAEEKRYSMLSSLVDRAATKGLTAEETITLKEGLAALAEKHPRAEKQHGLTTIANAVAVGQKPEVAATTSVGGSSIAKPLVNAAPNGKVTPAAPATVLTVPGNTAKPAVATVTPAVSVKPNEPKDLASKPAPAVPANTKLTAPDKAPTKPAAMEATRSEPKLTVVPKATAVTAPVVRSEPKQQPVAPIGPQVTAPKPALASSSVPKPASAPVAKPQTCAPNMVNGKMMGMVCH